MRTVQFIAVCSVFAAQALAQGDFQNLRFESAVISPIPGNLNGNVYFDQAFPGWIGICRGVQQTQALYDTFSLSAVDIAIIDNGPLSGSLIEGNYTAVLQGGDSVGGGIATISQTGLIPLTAQSLQLRIYSPPLGQFTVSIGGQNIALAPLQSGANYVLYAGDISSFANQSVELAISALPGNHFLAVDSIAFSSVPVPEPTALSFIALGLLSLGWRWRQNSRA